MQPSLLLPRSGPDYERRLKLTPPVPGSPFDSGQCRDQPRRLDFIVIGPAVNEAARLAAMCKTLAWPLVISAEIARLLLPEPLVSLGVHALRGVRRRHELFTPGGGRVSASPLTPGPCSRKFAPNLPCAAAAVESGMRQDAHLLSFLSLRIRQKAAPCGAAEFYREEVKVNLLVHMDARGTSPIYPLWV